jgi:hypothetical protein
MIFVKLFYYFFPDKYPVRQNCISSYKQQKYEKAIHCSLDNVWLCWYKQPGPRRE